MTIVPTSYYEHVKISSITGAVPGVDEPQDVAEPVSEDKRSTASTSKDGGENWISLVRGVITASCEGPTKK